MHLYIYIYITGSLSLSLCQPNHNKSQKSNLFWPNCLSSHGRLSSLQVLSLSLSLHYFLGNQTQFLTSIDLALLQIHRAGIVTSRSCIYLYFSLSKPSDQVSSICSLMNLISNSPLKPNLQSLYFFVFQVLNSIVSFLESQLPNF